MIANTIVAIAINKNAGNDAEEQIDNTTSNFRFGERDGFDLSQRQ